MRTLNEAELAHLRTDLFDLIVKHAGCLLPDGGGEQEWLTAMLRIDAAVRKVTPRVTKTLDARSLTAGLSQAAIARARGSSRQAVNGRVKKS